MSDGPTLPSATHIGRTALRVADLDAMVEFYRSVVGLDVLDRQSETAVLGVDDTALLVLDSADGAAARSGSSAGLFHNAFRFPSQEALGDALARVREDWQLDGASDHRVSEALYLSDPEGNGVELYRDFPRSAWPATDDGRVQMGTDPLDLSPLEAVGSPDSHAPTGTDIGHVHLEVTSLDAFRSFYVETLGFEEQMTVPSASFVSAGGYHHHLGANTWNRRSDPASGRGLAWFEVLVPDQQTLARIRERLVARDADVGEQTAGFAVRDPDGLEIRFRIDDE